MAKRIDFTQPGGMPLTQEILSMLQEMHFQNWKLFMQGLLAEKGLDTSFPVIIYDGRLNLEDSIIYYDGEVMIARYESQLGSTWSIEITESYDSLMYQDSSTPNVLRTRSARMTTTPAWTDPNLVWDVTMLSSFTDLT